MMPRNQDSVHVPEFFDDESSVDMAQLAELEEALEDGFSLGSDLEDDSESDDLEFFLDIGLLELSHCSSNHKRSGKDLEEQLETDSLHLIRKRVTSQSSRNRTNSHEQLPTSKTDSAPAMSAPTFKKFDEGYSAQVCEVPLGVSLKDIFPSTFFRRQSTIPPHAVHQEQNSGSLLEGIDKALEILSIDAM